MATPLNPAQQDVLAQLRGTPDERPAVRPELRRELQAEIEQGLRHVEGPMTVDKWMLNQVHQCEGRYLAVDDFHWSPSNAKGTIMHKAAELSAGGTKAVTPTKLVELAIERICENPDTRSLAEYIRNIDDGEQAELRVAATDLVIKFREMFPPLQDNWHVNAEATTAAYVGHRRVVFRGKIDLKLGAMNAERSSTLLIDIKTGNPSFTDMDDLRFYALLETLRTGVPPFRWANVYVSAGRAESEDVSEAVLRTATRRLIDGVIKLDELRDREARLTPGNPCRFCPARKVCEESVVRDPSETIGALEVAEI